MATQMTEHFSIAHFENALNGFTPPAGAFDPSGAWEHRYETVMCIGGVSKIGALSVERTPVGPDGAGASSARRARLRVRCRKRAAGGTLRCEAQLECRSDELCTPVLWRLASSVEDANGKTIADTRLDETGAARDGALEVNDGAKPRRIPVAEPFTFHWALLDAVQRLPRQAGPARRFTLVDRLSYQVKPGHTLAFRQSAVVELGGQPAWREQQEKLAVGTLYRPVRTREGATPTTLHAYEHVGEGILPIVYWVDDTGRLLLVLSGLIAHIYSPNVEV
jgi:hypothetical protein